jgi:hypothetical protein
MPRHAFDPVALVLGAVFVAAGAIVLAGGELITDGRALVPLGLIALGVALLVHVGRRVRPSTPTRPEPEPVPQVASERDLDALFAPVDEALADWEPTHAGVDATEVDPTRAEATEGAAAETPDLDPTGVDATDSDPTDATPADPTDADVIEVVDPTLRHPRSEPE